MYCANELCRKHSKHIKEYIQAYEITLKSEADCKESIWCNIMECVRIGDFYYGHIQCKSLVLESKEIQSA